MEKYIGKYHTNEPFYTKSVENKSVDWKSAGRIPPSCRFSQICHCRFTESAGRNPPSCRFSQICHCIFAESAGRNPPIWQGFHQKL